MKSSLCYSCHFLLAGLLLLAFCQGLRRLHAAGLAAQAKTTPEAGEPPCPEREGAEVTPEAVPAPPGPPAEAVAEEAEPAPTPTLANCGKLANDLQEPDLRGLVLDRLADLQGETAGDEAWGLALVDLLDELQLMQASYSPEDADAVSRLGWELRALLAHYEGELIDDSSWIPARQRAVKVERCLPEGAAARVFPTGLSGLLVRGELIRKQEVRLQLSSDS